MILAGEIQRHFLPRRMPDVNGYEFSVEYRPALAVGGEPLQRLVRRFIHSALIIPKSAIKDGTH